MRLAIAICALFVVCCLAPAPKANAASMNIEQMTCYDLMKMNEDAMGIVLVWIDGYYSGKTGTTKFDPDSWEGLGEMIDTICDKNPNRRVLEALDEVLRAMRGF